MKEILKLIFSLTVISSAAGLLLAYTYKVTAAPIAAASQQGTTQALAAVLPPFDNNPAHNSVTFKDNDTAWTFHVARKSGQFIGVAFETASRNGYGGEIKIMVGITADGHIKAIQILSQHETPGLGTKITEAPFKPQFEGKPIAGTLWAVKKDNGSFDAVTGATISSRAVLEAVKNGIAAYTKHATEIARTGE
jgi:electron transport complex protein RnfG